MQSISKVKRLYRTSEKLSVILTIHCNHIIFIPIRHSFKAKYNKYFLPEFWCFENGATDVVGNVLHGLVGLPQDLILLVLLL